MFIDYNRESIIKGIGIDMTDIRRYRKMSLEKQNHLSSKILTDDELVDYINSHDKTLFLAKIFCAKESIVKSMGTGFIGIGFKDIQIKNDSSGKPTVSLSQKANEIAKEKSIIGIQISITHEKDYVTCISTAY